MVSIQLKKCWPLVQGKMEKFRVRSISHEKKIRKALSQCDEKTLLEGKSLRYKRGIFRCDL